MQEYIWIDDRKPILNQLPCDFKLAAILLHPFVQLPIGWKQQYIYPSNEEILQHGKPVPWKRVMLDCSLNNLKELAIALKTSIGALNKRYAMPHLANKLNSKIEPDMFYPTD